MRMKSSRPLDAEAAREQCLRLLERRARSASELRQRLRERGYEQEIIDDTLAAMERAGLVDDEEFARTWVASRLASGSGGRRRLRWELQRKGLAEEVIRRTVDENVDDETELTQALALAKRRLREQVPDVSALARLRRLLLSRGYGFGVVDSVIRQLSSRREEPSEDM